MTRHLDADELDVAQQMFAARKTTFQIWSRLKRRRDQKGEACPTIDNVRRALKGKSHARGRKETRGRKKLISATKLRTIDNIRVALLKKAKGMEEVSLKKIKQKARLDVDDSTLSRAFKSIGVSWRSPREKPSRTIEQEAERKIWADKYRKKAISFWTDSVDLYIDCKKFALPLSARSREAAARSKIRGALRKRSEGLVSELTRPSTKKHRYPPGAQAWVLGGICGKKIRLWQYIEGRWNSKTAARMYTGPIQKTLKKHRPDKKRWKIVEDNDPSGFKSSAGKAAKQSAHITTIDLPTYSPDLQPLDYSIWNEVERRTTALLGNKAVSAKEYRCLLRQVAYGLPENVVGAAVASMRKRCGQIYEANGANIRDD
jgi:hypothetical protein